MSIDYSDMAFPKLACKKKRKSHKKSILKSGKGVCYLCSILYGDSSKRYTEEHEYQMIHYRVSVWNNKNFYADQVDTLKASGMDGFAGDKYRFIDKFQAWIE